MPPTTVLLAVDSPSARVHHLNFRVRSKLRSTDIALVQPCPAPEVGNATATVRFYVVPYYVVRGSGSRLKNKVCSINSVTDCQNDYLSNNTELLITNKRIAPLHNQQISGHGVRKGRTQLSFGSPLMFSRSNRLSIGPVGPPEYLFCPKNSNWPSESLGGAASPHRPRK